GAGAGAGAATHDQREADRLGGSEDDQGEGVGVPEPVEELVGLTMADLTERRERAGAGGRRQIVEIIAIDALDPEAVAFRVSCIAHTNRHVGFLEPEETRPGRLARAIRPGRVSQCRKAADNSLPDRGGLLLRRVAVAGR